MSGLAALLAGRMKPGIYRWHAMFEAQDVQHTVELAGWRFAHYSGWVHTEGQEVLAGLGASLALPDHCGGDLDALAGCLDEVVADGSKGALLLWDGWAPFARADGEAFSTTLGVFGARVDAGDGRPFAVLLRGDGAETADLPSLD